MRLLFIEGIPGSGKTEISKQLCLLIQTAGIEAKWYLEELSDHPVHPRSLLQRCNEPSFPTECLSAWQNFVMRAECSSTLHILDGSAFQSTVRFMMQSEYSEIEIEQYYRKFEDIIAPLSPALVYLRPANAFDYSHATARHRGASWSTKVAKYLSDTRYCQNRQLKGIEGMCDFWDAYAKRCDALLTTSKTANFIVRAVAGEGSRHLAEIVAYLKSRGVAPHMQLKRNHP
jgi:hypothetical protein